MAVSTNFHLLALLCLIQIFHIQLNPSHASRLLQISESKATTTTIGDLHFIKSSCSTTAYPDLCFSSLYSYTGSINNSPMLLARTALSISLDSARSTSTAMKSVLAAAGGKSPMSPREEGAMSDCMENVSDSIGELQDSLGEMGNLRGKNINFQISSIQTWVSAAITDDNTCMDGFAGKAMEGSGVKITMRGHVVNVVHLTSNALALINALASTTQSAAIVRNTP